MLMATGNNAPYSPQSIEEIGVIDLIEQDSRPTFIIDLHSALPVTPERMNVVFCNKSLRFFDDLRKLVMAPTFYPAYPEPLSPATSSSASTPSAIGIRAALEAEFKEWATSLTGFDPEDDGYMPRHTFQGMYWTCVTLKNRWRVISASQVPNQRRQSHGTPKSSSRSTSRSTSRTRECMDTDDMDLEQQLADSMSKFRVLTELNPVGMYYLSPDGNIVYANDMWYEITGHPRGLEGEMSFMNVISESDHPIITKEWETLVTQKGKRTFELRLRNPSYDDHGNPRQKWILASCDQEFDENGTLISIMGCM
jgi:PAS domain S-box-containing protein